MQQSIGGVEWWNDIHRLRLAPSVDHIANLIEKKVPFDFAERAGVVGLDPTFGTCRVPNLHMDPALIVGKKRHDVVRTYLWVSHALTNLQGAANLDKKEQNYTIRQCFSFILGN